MRFAKILTVSFLFLFALTNSVMALSSGNPLVDQFYKVIRVDSWPGQPNYPQQPPTNPIPPSWPGNPTNPTNPGYPGQGQYESADYLYSTGRRAFSQGNFYNAVQYLRKLLDRYPYDYRAAEACYLTGESYRRLNDFYNAITFFRRVSSQYSHYSEAHRAAYYVGYCMVKTTDYYGAINEFRNFVNRFPTSELVDDAWYVMGRTYEQVSDRNNAIMAYQQIVYNYPGSGFYSQALERLNYLQNNGETYPVPPTYPPGNPIPPSYPGNDNYISDYELYNRGHSALVSGNTNKAISYFDELLKRYPSSSYADDAYFWKGQARMQQKNYLDAIRQFENLQATFPGSELYGSSIYVMADCEYEYARLNAANRIYFQKAAGHYTWYQQAYPNNGQYSAQALVRAGECYEMMGEYSNAKYYYQQTIDLYPNTSAALKAKEKLNGFW